MPFNYTCPVCAKPFTHKASTARYCSRPCYWIAKKQPIERVWDVIDRRGPDDCWLWTACVNSKGYGRIGQKSIAHRVVWELTNGPIPDGLLVLHRCNTPACCNVAHLYLGTNWDNMRDRKRAGHYSSVEPQAHSR